MILTIEEARDALRLDGADNDMILLPLVEAIPQYLLVTTGKRWDDEGEAASPLAKTTAKMLLTLWYNPDGLDSIRQQRTVDNLLKALSALVPKG